MSRSSRITRARVYVCLDQTSDVLIRPRKTLGDERKVRHSFFYLFYLFLVYKISTMAS